MICRRLSALLVMVVVTSSGVGLIRSDSGTAQVSQGACTTQGGHYAAGRCLDSLARRGDPPVWQPIKDFGLNPPPLT